MFMSVVPATLTRNKNISVYFETVESLVLLNHSYDRDKNTFVAV